MSFDDVSLTDYYSLHSIYHIPAWPVAKLRISQISVPTVKTNWSCDAGKESENGELFVYGLPPHDEELC